MSAPPGTSHYGHAHPTGARAFGGRDHDASGGRERWLVGLVGSLAWAFDGERLRIAHLDRPVTS